MAVSMRIINFWNVTLCSLVEVHRYFRERTASLIEDEECGSSQIFQGTYCLRHRRRRVWKFTDISGNILPPS
jgi:hypothetical protein